MAKYRKLGRTSNQRKALLRNQVTQLLYHGKIRTTEAKAKEIRKIAEGLIALGVKEKDTGVFRSGRRISYRSCRVSGGTVFCAVRHTYNPVSRLV